MSLPVELHQLHVSPVRHASRHFAGNVENGPLFREKVLRGANLASKARNRQLSKYPLASDQDGRVRTTSNSLLDPCSGEKHRTAQHKATPFEDMKKIPCQNGCKPARIYLAIDDKNNDKHQRFYLLDVVELLQQLAEVLP